MGDDATRRRLLAAAGLSAATATAGCAGLGGDVAVQEFRVPDQPYAGDRVRFEADVANRGVVPVETVLALTLDGELAFEQAVSLGPRGETTVTLGPLVLVAGEYTVGVRRKDAETALASAPLSVSHSLVVEDASVPERTPDGSAVEATLTLRSLDEEPKTVEAVADTGDAFVGDGQEVTVPGGARRSVTARTYPDGAGDVTVRYSVGAGSPRVGVADAVGVAGETAVVPAWHQPGYGPGTRSAPPSAGPAESPEEGWATRVRHGVAAPPAVVDGVVYQPAANPYGASDRGAVQAHDAGDGTGRWRTELPGAALSTPVVVDDTVVVGTVDGELSSDTPREEIGGHLLGLTTDGEERWRRDVGAAVLGAPASADGAVYAATTAGDVVSVDARSGTARWRTADPEGVWGGVAVADDLLVRTDVDGVLRAADRADGTTRWTSETDGFAWASPVVAGDAVYQPVDRGRSGGRLSAVGTDGEVRWRTDLDGRPVAAPAVGEDGLYLGLGATTAAYGRAEGRRRWRTPDADAGSSGGSPAVADGVVYAGVGRVNGGRFRALDPATGETAWTVAGEYGGAAPTVLDGTAYVPRGYGHLVAYR